MISAHRIPHHGLADIPRGFRSGADFFREAAVGRRAAPSDLSSRGVDALEKGVRSPKSSLNLEKSVSSPSK